MTSDDSVGSKLQALTDYVKSQGGVLNDERIVSNPDTTQKKTPLQRGLHDRFC